MSHVYVLVEHEAEQLSPVTGELITAADLPVPTAAERKVPATIKRSQSPSQEAAF